MSSSAPRPCPQPGCSELIRGKQRACPEHMRQREARKPKRLRGRRLQERNARLFKQNPLCMRCVEEGLVTPVDEWDHRVPLEQGGADDESNLEGLCARHHREKTAREAHDRARVA